MLVVAQVQHLGDVLVRLERHQVCHVLALGVAAGFHELVRLGAVDPAQVGEEEQPVVGGGDEEVFDDVVAAQLRALDALAAALLRAVVVAAGALDVAAAGNGDDHFLLGDQILDGHVAVVAQQDLGAAVIAVLGHDLREFGADDLALALLRGQDRVVFDDQGLKFGVLVLDLLALQGGEPAQLHVQDGPGLHLVDVQQLHQPVAGRFGGGGRTDQGNDLIERIQRLEKGPQDVRFLLRLPQPVPGAAGNDVHLVRDPVPDEGIEAERARHAVDDREHVGGEVVLQLGVLVEVVQHHLGHGVALEHDHQSLAGAARGLVAEVGDAGDLAVLDEFGDLDGQVVRVGLVRQLGDHQARAALEFLDVDHGAHRDGAAARAVGVLDALVAQDRGAGREVRSLDALDQLFEQLFAAGGRVGQVPLHTVGDLTEVVRRDVGGHADGDARGTVHQQVREPGRQDGRLLVLAVVVVLEVDGFLVDVPDHLHGQRRHLGFGVPRGGRAVVAGRAEVALAQCQRVAHGPVLDQADQGVVDRGVAVRVVLAHDLAHHAGTLVEGAFRAVAAVEHRIEHAAVDGLEAVADIRQGTAHDHSHGVVEVGALHFGLQVHLLDAVGQYVAIEDGAFKDGLGAGRHLWCFVTHSLYFPFQVYISPGIFGA
ncbi:hypothetical protein SRABI128_04361 [Microbacterium sp. Bi128]|nr:hypothetical protein SRABI128_04361 [Microbacterium sp. Bi128]